MTRSGRLAISVGSLTFSLVDYPNPCHPGCVRQGHAGEPDAGLSGIGADGATTPGNSQAPGPLGWTIWRETRYCVHRRGHPRRKARVNLSGTATDGGQLVGFGRSGPCLIAEILRGTHCRYWRRHNRHYNYLCSHRSRPYRYGIRPPALRSDGDVFCEWWAAFSEQLRGLESAIYVTESC